MRKLSVAIVFVLLAFCVGCKKVKTTDFCFPPDTTTDVYTSTQIEPINYPIYINIGEFMLTAYCPCYECSDKWGDMTATGVKAKEGRTIAVDKDVIPYGCEVIIGGNTYRAEDCGGKVIGKHIDIYFESHEEADNFGVKYADVLLKVGKDN